LTFLAATMNSPGVDRDVQQLTHIQPTIPLIAGRLGLIRIAKISAI
jgi:hypothetical protein